ncbi:MAG: hypothetical protein LBH06_03815 [Rikenellaceae bacterium]|jgi:predicted RNA-binding protein (virulence factor B family)|nr:hypothetical protein [Rikenellaceae bacterium]
MLSAGKYHTLTVARISDHGLYLADDEGCEVLLPNRFISLADKVGDTKEVFVYHDSEDRLVASTERPLATVGEVALLRTVDKNIHGAFLDWGLKAKHLFVPNRNQKTPMRIGESYLVYLYEDSRTSRAVGTARLNSYISNSSIALAVGERVSILVAMRLEAGYRVVVNNAHWGMIYTNQLFRPVVLGEKTEGWVAKITEDSRIDISLQQGGYDGIRACADELLALLASAGGMLPLGDASSPADIAAATRMSKKVFKRAAGHLLKTGRVELTPQGIKLLK